MKRLIIAAVVLAGLAGTIRVVLLRLPTMMEPMMENVMPGMMDHCFSRVDRERRQSMLRHCRGMLDQMESKYLQPERGNARPPGS
jgi:hypothetical protein